MTKLTPDEAVERYLSHRQNEVSKQTLDAHRYRLQHFPRWCAENGIEGVEEMQPQHLQEYRHWRQKDGDLNPVSMKTQMSTFRVFIKWAEDYNAVPQGFSEHIRIPNPDTESRDARIDLERVDAILKYLSNYEYASQRHVLFELLWHTGMRLGAVHSLDVQDYARTEDDDPYLNICHRPQTGTPLKNKENGERPLVLDGRRATLLDAYLDARRNDVRDDHGRKPLLTTRHGRAARSTLRDWVYSLARPCVYTNDCPHDREINECDAASQISKASQCPSSFSPHTIRHTSITYWLSKHGKDQAGDAVSSRMNVNRRIIEEHYDERTDIEKMEQRRDLFT